MARSFVQLSLDERRVVARMYEKKISQAEIARTLRRDRSTICRELRRNFWHDRDVPIAEGYWHVTAHAMAADRRRKYRKLLRERTMRRIDDVLQLPLLPEATTPATPRNLDIRFENVSFSYGEAPVLNGIDLVFEAGKIHALVGASGSGKSTVLSLLARFWDPAGGRIAIGGVDLRQIAPELRAKLFAPVFQDTYLFDDTVAANLRIGNPQASDEELESAARAAHCHEFINGLENGYQTKVGEGGSRLSGGERQRIAIARAILKDAPIVLLDEATASIDPDNEHEIRRALSHVCAGKTVILIAHRPQTYRNVDQVVELKRGRS